MTPVWHPWPNVRTFFSVDRRRWETTWRDIARAVSLAADRVIKRERGHPPNPSITEYPPGTARPRAVPMGTGQCIFCNAASNTVLKSS